MTTIDGNRRKEIQYTIIIQKRFANMPLFGDNMTNDTSMLKPKRYIFNMQDMEHFKKSSAKRELLSFVTALGKGTISSAYALDLANPLKGLSPGMACLHGCLRAISDEWLKELPPDAKAKARFGNPVFKRWHARLSSRSWKMIECILDCHVKHAEWDEHILRECSDAGAKVASEDHDRESDATDEVTPSPSDSKQDKVIAELQAYLILAFGHEIRIDYGTGHECCFFVFLFALCKIGVFGNKPKTSAPSNDIMAPVACAITTQYLEVCRGVQDKYMLEPAGSHGVWGLDDYHCIPFYLGACQMQNPVYDDKDYMPSSIHNDEPLRSSEGSTMIYFQCIQYIKDLKKGAPFFETSPMLDDISRLPNWAKVGGGLLRLFEGEVLSKKPVVQHFVFGEIFKATWVPSQSQAEAPTSLFVAHGVDAVAPWASRREGKVPPPTKAPWAT
jgi:serine/threonine-protein phosphatase 2A activator